MKENSYLLTKIKRFGKKLKFHLQYNGFLYIFAGLFFGSIVSEEFLVQPVSSLAVCPENLTDVTVQVSAEWFPLLAEVSFEDFTVTDEITEKIDAMQEIMSSVSQTIMSAISTAETQYQYAHTMSLPKDTIYSELELSDDEVAILERIVEAEATDGDIESKMHVAHVVLNRCLSSEFPNSVKGVVFQKKQFSPISDGRYYKVVITDETREAVQNAIYSDDTTDGALYFANISLVKNTKTKGWFSTLNYLFTDTVGHSFYK